MVSLLIRHGNEMCTYACADDLVKVIKSIPVINLRRMMYYYKTVIPSPTNCVIVCCCL